MDIIHKCIRAGMFLVNKMRFPAFFMPYCGLYGREVSIYLRCFGIDFRQAKHVCQWHCLFIYTCSADNIYLFLRLTALQSCFKGREYFCTDSNVFLPMMMVFPVVNALKRFKSLGSQNNNLFWKPIPKLRSTAAMILIMIGYMIC